MNCISQSADQTKLDADNPSSLKKYEVLYYKRSTKVHKTKGTTRMDGILSIHLRSNQITLQPAQIDNHGTNSDVSESEQDDDEEDDTMTFKQKMKMRRKKMNAKGGNRSAAGKKNTQFVYNGKNAEIVKRVLQKGSLDEDDIVVLSAWECQIVSIVSFQSSTSGSASTSATAGLIGKDGSGTLSKSKCLPGRSKLTANRKVLGKSHLSLHSSNLKSNPVLKRKTPLHSLKSKNQCTSSTTGYVMKRNPPAQPKPKSQGSSMLDKNPLEENDMMESDKAETRSVTVPTHKQASNFQNRIVKKRKLVQGTMSKRTSDPNGNSINLQNDNVFRGAIGTLQAPASIKSILRPHQQTGVVFLWNCLTGACPRLKNLMLSRNEDGDENGNGNVCGMGGGAILADEMGLGKTLMTITTIFALHRRNRNDRFIVVCPSSLVMNWANEFDKFVGKASQPKRIVIRKGGEEGVQRIKSFAPSKANRSEVLIISYDQFRNNSAILSQAKNIGLLVVDEGHRLKNTAGTKVLSALTSLKCDARLLISGTPIQNNLSEFYNVVNFVLPGILGDLNSFRRAYERPIAAGGKKDASNNQKERAKTVSKELEKITSLFMIRRLQKDILRDFLPARFETLLFCRPSSDQCKMYSALTSGSDSDNLTTLTNLRKLCSHPDLIKDNSRLSPTTSSKPGKLDILEKLLAHIRSENPSDKVVVVSNFTSALTIIDDHVLKPRGWSSVRLDGTTQQSLRQTIVDSFNRGSADNSYVFLLSSKAGGCGLNLIGANRLVLFDLDWNPATDAQAMARIYRQGQKKECHIYRLVTTGTVEEIILQRQIQKTNLDTIASKRSSRDKWDRFTDEELRDCFTLKVNCKCDTETKLGGKWDKYVGVESLTDQGVLDKPLLALATREPNILTYAHVVKDHFSVLDESEMSSSDEEDRDWDCFDEDSEEEAEFDG